MKTARQSKNCVRLLNQLDKVFANAIPTHKYNPIIAVSRVYQYKHKVRRNVRGAGRLLLIDQCNK